MLRSFLVFLVLILVACTKGSFKEDGTYSTQLSRLRNGYLHTRELIIQNLRPKVDELRSKANDFYSLNNQFYYDRLVSAWIDIRYDFLLVSPYMYGDNSIAIPGSSVYDRMEIFPINPGYIDYTSANPTSGIINDAANYPIINAFNLKSWHQQGGIQNVTCGLHALEFLLWGEDANSTGPGSRPLTDFQNLRRRQFLIANAAVFDEDYDLINVHTTFKNDLLKLSPQESFRFIITGLSKFIRDDFAIKSIKKPLDSYSDADEISRFSDQTTSDLKAKLKALNLFLNPRELYFTSSDYFLIDFIQDVDQEMYSRIQANLAILDQKINYLSVAFDQAILNTTHRQNLLEAYDALIGIEQDLQSLKAVVK